MKRRINWLIRIGTVFCWLGSLLSLTPFIGMFFIPAALLGGLLVWCCHLSIKEKLVRGFLPVVVPAILYGRWFIW